jgi:hypothetical protein
LAKATLSISDWMSKSPTASSAAAGFAGIHTHLFADAKALTALEELRQKLGLDALAVLANTTSSYDRGVILGSIQFYLYGPNPVPKPAQKIAQYAWSPGYTYAHGDFAKGFKGVEFARMKKGQIETETYEGYGKLVETTADATLDAFDVQYGR